MSDTLESRWNEFVRSYIKKTSPNDVWAQTISQLQLLRVSDSVAYFLCPNTGVKTVALNKQSQLASILSAVAQTPVFSIHCEVVPKKKMVEKKLSQPTELPLLNYKPTFDEMSLQAGLNPRFSFENYAVSSCNNVAFAAAQVVSSQSGSVYNPLFIWGGVGVGKTHLAQATGKKILQRSPGSRVYFCPGDKFTNEIIEAIKNRNTDKFRQKYRRLDVLIIDDIQFISGKQTVQEEFFHTFNDIVSRGGQVILASDRPPHQIQDIEDRLRSRFSGGLIIDISPPDFELRAAIVLIKARERGIDIDMDAAKSIAEIATDNRAVEGVLLSSYARVMAHNQTDVLPTLTKEHIQSYTQGQQSQEKSNVTRIPSIEAVLEVVCSYYQIKPLHLKQANRTEHIARARHVLMYILRDKLGINYETIAHGIRRKDHTTVIHGVHKIRQAVMHDQYIKNDIAVICQNLNISTDTSK